MTRTALYLRISQDRLGDGLAVERQQEDCEKIANDRGWKIVKTYSDTVSASNPKKRRPAYERMVKDFEAGRLDAIVCWDLDRLTRQPRELEDWIDRAKDRGLQLVTANGEADLTQDAGQLFARVKAAVARSEVDRKARRQTRAAQQRADLGKPPLGVRLTGYTIAGDLIDDEAALVRRVFENFHKGVSLYMIAKNLTAEGIPSRTGSTRWNPSTIRTMLTNPRYAGRAVYQGKETGKAGGWEPIVSEALFDAVNRTLNDESRIKNREGTARKHLGSSLFECARCYTPVVSNGTRYYCRTCGMTRTRVAIDTAVRETVSRRLAQPDVALLLAPTSDPQEDERIENRIRDLRARLTQIEDDYDNDLIDGKRFRAANEKTQAALDEVLAQRAAKIANPTLSMTLAAPRPEQAFNEADLETQRAIIRSLGRVLLRPARQGHKGFRPESVLFTWHIALVDLENLAEGELPRFQGGAVADEVRGLLTQS